MEAVICFVFIIAGLVFMSRYTQRAMQGNLFGAAQAVGAQFDPRDVYAESQTIRSMQDTVKQEVSWGMYAADLQPATELTDFMHDVYVIYNPRLVDHRGWILETVPSGPVFREPAAQQSEMTANWDVTRTGTYHDLR